KKSIELISKNYGKIIEPEKIYYGFPKAEELAEADEEEFQSISRTGFRAKRVIDTSKIIADNQIDIDSIFKVDKNKLKEILMSLPGVGPKVSDCVLVYAFNKGDAFPVDVWVKRVMEHFYLKKDTNVKYIGKYGTDLFGDLAGFAQQYLFYYAREQSIGK